MSVELYRDPPPRESPAEVRLRNVAWLLEQARHQSLDATNIDRAIDVIATALVEARLTAVAMRAIVHQLRDAQSRPHHPLDAPNLARIANAIGLWVRDVEAETGSDPLEGQ